LRAVPASPQTAEAVQFKQAKQLDWELLKLWAQLGEIQLKYLDESGCYCHSPTDYGYAQKGQQKRIRQRRRRGRRINILGIFQPEKQFDYALMVGTLKSATFLKLMDWQATKAQLHFQKTGQISVIVLDNASVHKSHLTTAAITRWQSQGLLLFFLPPYNPQMNRIEDEWLHLKRDELASRVFEDEIDLAYAIITGIETRGKQGKYPVERFMFN
jgi:putative transposase